jgi:hypothetical protein
MKAKKKPSAPDETVDLLRGGAAVRSLFGSFGNSIRETRLTSILGYLLAQEPGPWRKLFRISEPLSLVRVEFSREAGRADIWMETASESIVLEAKLTGVDPTVQSKKYMADRSILLSCHQPNSSQLRGVDLYFSWLQIARFLQTEYLTATKVRSDLRFLAKEVVKYMAENGLSRTADVLEVYVREINISYGLTLFLKGQLYTCPYEKSGKAGQALYFAPHFGQKLARELPAIYSGISFVAKIEAVEVVDEWRLLKEAAKKHRGGHWVASNRDVIAPLRKHFGRRHEQRTALFLSEPRLVFNPPINKNLLQKGTGYLSRRAFSFDELFAAWAKSASARIDS